MRMKKIAGILILSCMFFEINAQTIIEEGYIRYTETKKRINAAGKEMIRVVPHIIRFSPTTLNVISEPKSNITISQVSDPETKTGLAYATNNSDKYFLSEEKYLPRFFYLGLYNRNKPDITLETDTLTIKNIKCNKAVFTFQINGQAEKMEVWYSRSFKIKTSSFDYFFEGLDGLPVSFKFKERPEVTVGTQAQPDCEYILDTVYTTTSADIGEIKDKEKYVKISEAEKGNRLMELMSSNAPARNAPTGTPIRQTYTASNGTTVTVTKYNPFKEGTKALDFKALNLEGTQRSLESFKGKVVVMNFWFVQCMPCIAEMPYLNKVAAAFKDENVSFLGVSYNTKEEMDAFFKTRRFDFEKIINAQTLIDNYGVSSYPSTIIIDKEGIIRFTKIGATENEQELKEQIRKLL
jgi:peroxiredoxin